MTGPVESVRLWTCTDCGARRIEEAGEDDPARLACPYGHEGLQVGTATSPSAAAVALPARDNTRQGGA